MTSAVDGVGVLAGAYRDTPRAAPNGGAGRGRAYDAGSYGAASWNVSPVSFSTAERIAHRFSKSSSGFPLLS